MMLSRRKLTLIGAFILVLLAAPLAVVSADIPGLVSDDFHAGFDTSRWIPDPLEEYTHDASLFTRQQSGGDSYLQIEVPAGTKRSLSASIESLQAPRVLQPVTDDGKTPFIVTARFLSVPSFPDEAYAAMQGIILKGVYDHDLNPGTLNYPAYWRFSVDTGAQPGQVDLFSAFFYQTGETTFGGFSDVYPTPGIAMAASTPIWLKVDRMVEEDTTTGDFWSTFDYAYSTNGTSWTSLIPGTQDETGPLNQIRQTFVVTHIGVFAGTTGENPAYNAKIDWVSTTNQPPDGEDEGAQPTTYTLSYNANPTGGTITGDAPDEYDEGQTVTLNAAASTGYVFQNWTVNGQPAGTNATLQLVMDGDKNVAAVFVLEEPPVEPDETIFLPMIMR